MHERHFVKVLTVCRKSVKYPKKVASLRVLSRNESGILNARFNIVRDIDHYRRAIHLDRFHSRVIEYPWRIAPDLPASAWNPHFGRAGLACC
jgi:hypothetical protein